MTADDLAALRRVVSVKPLEWVARDDIVDLYNAQSPTGWWYNIRKLQDGRFKYSGDPAASPVPTAQTFQCLDFAKAAAQDDYERRILSALTLASRALPAAPDVGEDALVREIGDLLLGRVNAPEGAIYQAAREVVGIASTRLREQARREAIAECLGAAQGVSWSGTNSVRVMRHKIIAAIEALAEKKP